MIMIIYLMRMIWFFSLVRLLLLLPMMACDCRLQWEDEQWTQNVLVEFIFTIFVIWGGVQFMSNYIANCKWLHWILGSFDAQPNRMANSKFIHKISNTIFGCQMPPTPYMLAIDVYSGRLQFYYNGKNSVIACVCRLCHLWKSHGKSEFCLILHFHYYYYYLVTL